MIKTKLHPVGGSIDLRIPKPVVKSLKLEPDMEVILSTSNGCLLVEPVFKRRRYTLDELLAKCDLSVPMTAEEREWLDDKPIGEEEI